MRCLARAAAVQESPAVKNLPAGVAIREVGDAEVMGELFASFGLAMVTGVLCIYIVGGGCGGNRGVRRLRSRVAAARRTPGAGRRPDSA